MLNCLSGVAALGFVVVAISGCTVHGSGRGAAYVDEPVSTVTVTSAPVGYNTYPNTVYEGRTVYYVDNRWGYPRGDQWVYYRNEPPPLVRYRTRVESRPRRHRVSMRRPIRDL